MKLIKENFKTIISELHNQNQQWDNASLRQNLDEIKNAIISKGDLALRYYTEQFDRVSNPNFQFLVSPDEIKKAYQLVSSKFITAISNAKQNLENYHRHQFPSNWQVSGGNGIQYGAQFSAIETVGIYVPGGRAIYPSTVLMNTIPAKIAGCLNIIMASPPKATGEIAPEILVAADICGVTAIYRMGGSQAVFALAYGTETVPKVDKIVGPGNIYVTLAKQMVYGRVDIDKPAGPSEALIYIQNPQYIPYAAVDFLAQLEHDPQAQAIIISENEALLTQLQTEITQRIPSYSRASIIEESLKNSYLFLSSNLETSVNLINECASEHVVLLIDNPESISSKIKNAGALFLGPFTPVTLGDYYAGTNHVLPTSGTARFASPLGVMDFMKYTSLLSYSADALTKTQDDISILTQVEGFDAHYQAIQERLDTP